MPDAGSPRIAELHERTSDFVNRAVAAPCDDEIGVRGSRFERQLVRVIATLRQADNPIHAQTGERAGRNVDSLCASPSPPRPGYRIDDDEDARHTRETSRNPFGTA